MVINYEISNNAGSVSMAFCFGACCVDLNGGSSGKNGS